MSETLITLAGIGNRSVGDDGISLYLLETIQDQLPDEIDVQLWEDQDALSIAAELMEIQTPVVIVDCADMGLNSGEYRWFEASECYLAQQVNSLSTHGFGFADALALAQTLGFMQSVFFFAIQPEQLNFNEHISATLQNRQMSMNHSLLQHLQQLMHQLMSQTVGGKINV